MSAVALPRKLIAPPRISGDDRVSCSKVELFPANASGATEFSPNANSRIVFNIPSYSQSFINPQRSYLSFKITKSGGTPANSRLADGLPWLDRFTCRVGSQVVEDIQDYNVLERAMNLMETTDEHKTRASLQGDYGDIIRQMAGANIAGATHADLSAADGLISDPANGVIAQQNAGKTYTKPLLSGVMGKGQEFYLPVGLFEGSGSFAIQLELYLAAANQVVKLVTGSSETPTYTLSNVRLHLEVVTLPQRAMNAFNGEIAAGGMVSLPFKTFRVHKQHISSTQASLDVNISEAAQDIQRVITCLRPTLGTQNYNTLGHLSDRDAFDLYGGTGNTTGKISKWQFRYGNKYYPSAAVENDGGSTPSMLASLSSTDMLLKAPKLLSTRFEGTPYYEYGAFVLQQGFKTSQDDIINGLNAAASGAPIQLFLTFNGNAGADFALDSFVESGYVLNVKRGGHVSMVDGDTTTVA